MRVESKTGIHKWRLAFRTRPICLNCGHQIKRYQVGPYGWTTPKACLSQQRNAMSRHEKGCWKQDMDDQVTYERLPNGLIRVFDRRSKLAGCWHPDGTPAHGDLTTCTGARSIGGTVQRMGVASII